jgi:3-hydroxyanthranilate 3,4-dioxygenase
LQDGKHELAVLNAGDLFLLPRNLPHSPRRADGSWTLVVERIRSPQEIDRFIWPCEKCGNNLCETEVRFDDPSDAVTNATNRMKSDPALATCNNCGQVLEL